MAEPSLQAIVDRLAIEDLLTKYSWSIDTKQFDGLDDVFTADAHIDYTSSGGVKGPFPEVKAWLAKVLPSFPAYQHLVTNKQVVIDGDAATCRAEFYNPMIMAGKDGATSIFFVGGEYRDKMVRTDAGWRIAERIEVSIWTDGAVPEVPPES